MIPDAIKIMYILDKTRVIMLILPTMRKKQNSVVTATAWLLTFIAPPIQGILIRSDISCKTEKMELELT